MQDRYTGDIGDYGKYGLLRQLCGIHPKAADRLRLGVLWYRPDPSTVTNENADDGKFTSYLRQDPEEKFQPCDPNLYDALHKIVVQCNDRRVKKVELSRVLGPDALFHDAYIPGPAPNARGEARAVPRRAWRKKALRTTERCEIVFLDPDNGLEPRSVAIRHKAAVKYAYLEEIEPLLERGQSLVIYHHLSRKGTHTDQITHWLKRLQQEFNPADSFALRYRRGSARAFFVLAQQRHTPILRERAAALLASPWQQHFELHEPAS